MLCTHTHTHTHTVPYLSQQILFTLHLYKLYFLFTLVCKKKKQSIPTQNSSMQINYVVSRVTLTLRCVICMLLQ
jgi:hypothetical protein